MDMTIIRQPFSFFLREIYNFAIQKVKQSTHDKNYQNFISYINIRHSILHFRLLTAQA